MCPRNPGERADWRNDQSSALDGKSKTFKTLDTSTIDINPHKLESNGQLVGNADLEVGLRSSPKKIPVRFLYDDLGSELYAQITELEEYYPYMEEKKLLRDHADTIVSNLPASPVMVELGCGDGSKTALLLQALARRDGSTNVHFVGIDVSGGALQQAQRNLQVLCPDIPPPNLEFIEAEYFPGLEEAHKRHPNSTLCMMWLGSSVGNFTFPEAAAFLRDLRASAGERSALLLCTDLWKDRDVLHTAYDDPKGVTRKFILNGMAHMLRTLGHPERALDVFQYDCVVNCEERQVEMWVVAKEDIKGVIPGVDFKAGERILMEISRKFTPNDIAGLAMDSGLCLQATWASHKYAMQLLLPPLEALRRCWTDTDALFSHISDWTAKPIGLRHPFGFYYGHVAAFTRSRMLPERTPSGMDEMLSRGIDPLVLNPSTCHSHPDIPKEWPAPEELKRYVEEARADIIDAARTAGAAAGTSQGMRALAMSLEHERMHQETLCYMAAQQRKVEWSAGAADSNKNERTESSSNGNQSVLSNPLPLSTSPLPFYFNYASYLASSSLSKTPASANGEDNAAAVTAAAAAAGRKTSPVKDMKFVPGGNVTLGIDLSEKRGFVWDNELGTAGPFTVPDLQVATHPVTVAQFLQFVEKDQGYSTPELWDPTEYAHFSSTGHSMPSTWSRDANGEVYVIMPEGTFHWKKVAHCPVYCSLAEAQAYCKLYGGRVMTEPEWVHLVAAGAASGEAAAEVVGLEGGAWEWTSSLLEPFNGFSPDPLYPEYSTDFFDGSHYVLRGGGTYTHPSVLRRSFRNYYQRLYPHMFAKFRIVLDSSKEE